MKELRKDLYCSARYFQHTCETARKLALVKPFDSDIQNNCSKKVCLDSSEPLLFFHIGVLQLVVKCVKDSNRSQIVSDSLCNATKPSRGSYVSCNMGVCSTIYLWKMFWGNCSVHCGTGVYHFI